MASQYINVLSFAGLAVGVPASLPHGLNFNGRALVPDEVIPQIGGFTVTADATNVTVTRTDSSPAAVSILIKAWPSSMRAFGATNPAPGIQPDGSLALQPFVFNAGGSEAVGRYAPPEKWFQDNVAASQARVTLGARVSALFTGIKMVRGGSIVGVSSRFNTPITAGTLTVNVKINDAGAIPGVPVVSTPGSNASGGEALADPGVRTFVAGDVIGMDITTDAAFLPNTLDMEAWLEIDTD